MPPKTPRQERFMRLCLGNPGKATKKCPSKKDARKVLGIGEKKSKK